MGGKEGKDKTLVDKKSTSGGIPALPYFDVGLVNTFPKKSKNCVNSTQSHTHKVKGKMVSPPPQVKDDEPFFLPSVFIRLIPPSFL
jgi:hypothetical protein